MYNLSLAVYTGTRSHSTCLNNILLYYEIVSLRNMTSFLPVKAQTGITVENFESEVAKHRTPCVLKGVNIGSCTDKWQVDYLMRNAGSKIATVHVCETPQMNFATKNYLYRKLPFDELVKRASEKHHRDYFLTADEFYYFRSLGEDVRKEPSNIAKQWPEIYNDINLPNFFPEEKFFSSVFRIASAGMQLWTHYDVMDNLLVQVGGRKKVVLFPPQEALNLYLEGDKSVIVDVENPNLEMYPKFADVIKYKCILEPGDILFIPALWFHNVTALQFGIAVNVFWKNLNKKLYDPKDPYGNKDLIPAARSMDILSRALKVLNELPEEYKDFYARKMISKIKKNSLSEPAAYD